MTTITVTREWTYWIRPEPGEWADLKVRQSGITICPDQLQVDVIFGSSASEPRLARWKISGQRRLKDLSLSESRAEGDKYTMSDVPAWITHLAAECVRVAGAEAATVLITGSAGATPEQEPTS